MGAFSNHMLRTAHPLFYDLFIRKIPRAGSVPFLPAFLKVVNRVYTFAQTRAGRNHVRNLNGIEVSSRSKPSSCLMPMKCLIFPVLAALSVVFISACNRDT